jgi:hypothetical protein
MAAARPDGLVSRQKVALGDKSRLHFVHHASRKALHDLNLGSIEMSSFGIDAAECAGIVAVLRVQRDTQVTSYEGRVRHQRVVRE